MLAINCFLVLQCHRFDKLTELAKGILNKDLVRDLRVRKLLSGSIVNAK